MSSPILEARNVNLLFKNGGDTLHVLRDVSFALQPGEVASVVGPSGSGKTSLLMVLAGLEKATSGVISINGSNIAALDEDQLAIFRRNNFGILFQNFHLIPSMTALDNVAFALEIAHPSRPYAAIRRTALEALAEVGLAARANHLPSALSGGEQQRVGLARAIVGEPRILLADEPTGNLDSKSASDVLGILQSLARDAGKTVVMVTHDPKAASYGTRSLHLEKGEFVA